MPNGTANTIKQKGVKIELDKERTLLFDLNTLADMEEEFGDIEAAMDSIATGKMKVIRKLLWYALRHEDESLTEKQTGALVTLDIIQDLPDKLYEAMGVSMPETTGKNV